MSIAEMEAPPNGSAQNPIILQQQHRMENQQRGEVDTQISTAKRYPRSIKAFKERAMSLATLDEETASSCFYSLPRDGKNIEGPSARLAEIVANSWGNMRAQANVVDMDGQFVVARGVCWDLESNTAISVDVRRRITNKQGRRFSDDMIGVTSNAACSIALRNAVFKVVPMAICKGVYEAARKVAIGDATTLVKRRGDMIAYFGKMGVSEKQVCAAVDKAGVDDIGLEELATLKGMATAIKEGDTSVDEAFPALESKKKTEDSGKSKSDELAERIAAQKKESAKPAQETKADREPGDDLPAHETETAPPEEMESAAYQYIGQLLANAKTLDDVVIAEQESKNRAKAGEMVGDEYDRLALQIASRRVQVAAEQRKKSGKLVD